MLVVLADFLVHSPHLGYTGKIVRPVYILQDRLLRRRDVSPVSFTHITSAAEAYFRPARYLLQ
jgi:hypothetical protein